MNNRGDYTENWEEIAFTVKLIHKFKCEVCGRDKEELLPLCLTVHHLDGRKKNNFYLNLLCCCQSCHLRIQAKFYPEQMFLSEEFIPDWYFFHFPENVKVGGLRGEEREVRR